MSNVITFDKKKWAILWGEKIEKSGRKIGKSSYIVLWKRPLCKSNVWRLFASYKMCRNPIIWFLELRCKLLKLIFLTSSVPIYVTIFTFSLKKNDIFLYLITIQLQTPILPLMKWFIATKISLSCFNHKFKSLFFFF